MGTPFQEIYDAFLTNVTEDLYSDLRYDIDEDEQTLLIQSLPDFEFPKFKIFNYSLVYQCFDDVLHPSEISILGLLMAKKWLSRQIMSTDLTKQQYTANEFKRTSQAAHLSTLLSLNTEIERKSKKEQRLYGRRIHTEDGYTKSNWSIFSENSALE